MDVLAELVPHGSREEWLLEALGVSVALLMALGARLGAPQGVRVRLGGVIAALALNAVFFIAAELIVLDAVRSVLGALAIIFIALAFARAVFLLAFDVVIARNRRAPVPRIVRDLSQGAILLVAALISLRSAGVEPGQLLTTSALLTVVAGMALQETLGNLVAGLAIQTERPFEVGDWIEVHGNPGHIGRVREINWRATRLHTLDNVDVVVPNGLLAKATFTNYDRPHRAARRSIYFHTSYDVPTRVVHDAVLAAIADAPGVLATPAPSMVTFAFTDSGVQYWLRFFVDDMGRRDAIDGGVRDRVWYALARHGVRISVPARTINVHESSEASEQAKDARALQDRLEALAKIDLLSPLNPAEMRALAERVRTAMFAPGEVVIRQGDRGDTMFVARHGELSVRVGDAEAARLADGSFFGEMSLLTGEPRKATIVALTACELLVIDHEAFQSLLLGHPDIADMIGAKVVERMAVWDRAVQEKTGENHEASGAHHVDLVQRIRRFFGLREHAAR